MALTINPKITFNGKEAREGILEPAFKRPEMTRIMDIRSDLKAKEQIAFLGRIDKVTKTDAGCGIGKQNRTIPMSEKFWDPVKLKIWLSFCEDDLENTFYVYLTKNGVDRRDVTAVSAFWNQWVMEVFSDAVLSDALRLAWFADTDVAKVSDGGVLSNTADVSDYNHLDGFWKQIFEAVTSGLTKRVEISENAEANYDDQLALAEDGAYQILRKMINEADPRLRQANDKIFLVTETLFQNRIDQKESLNPGLESMFKRQDTMFQEDQYRGIPIISMDTVWDKYIQSDFNDGTKYDLPHRAVLTTVSNLVAGFDAVDAVDSFKTWYNDDTEENNFKGGYKFDVKHMQEFMTVAAY